jgi:hypothetical protein
VINVLKSEMVIKKKKTENNSVFFFWRAAYWRPGTNFDLSRSFKIFAEKCGEANSRSVFPELSARLQAFWAEFPIAYPHMRFFCYF